MEQNTPMNQEQREGKNTQKKPGKRNRFDRRIRIILSAVLALVIVAGVVFLIVRQVQLKKAADEYDKLKEAVKETDKEPKDVKTEEPVVIPYEGIPEVDFETLWQTTEDICAWITIPGTQVDYPVLRNEETKVLYDDYYLNHTPDGTSGLPGSIYMQLCNAKDFSDYNTVLYGHNMKNGSMFGCLHNFEDDTFFEEHEYVYVVTPEKILVYRIFAGIKYDNRHILVNYDMDKEEERQAFLDSIKKNGDELDNFREGVEVTAKDRILVLSTCYAQERDRRWLTVAVLENEYENW